MYNYINNIDVNDKLFYLIIIIGSIFFSGSIIKPSGTSIVGLVIGVILVYYIHDKRENQGDTFISSMKVILESDIMTLTNNQYLSKNSELVIFLNNYKEYYNYNPDLWKLLLTTINNFLKLIHEIETGTKYYNLDYSVVKEYKTRILNHYHSFIHNVPHAETVLDKFHKGFKDLESSLNIEIDKTHQVVSHKNSKAIDISSVFHYKNHPEGIINSNKNYPQYQYLP